MKKSERPVIKKSERPVWMAMRPADYSALLQFVQRVQRLTAFVRRLLTEVEGPSATPPRARRKLRKDPLQ